MGHLVTILNRKSKNLLPSFRSWTIHANAVVNAPYTLTLNATANFNTSQVFIPVAPNQTYVLSGSTSTATDYFFVFYYDASGTQIGNAGTLNSLPIGAFSGSFTTPSNCAKVLVQADNGSGGAGTFTFTNPQLQLGSLTTPFEPQ